MLLSKAAPPVLAVLAVLTANVKLAAGTNTSATAATNATKRSGPYYFVVGAANYGGVAETQVSRRREWLSLCVCAVVGSSLLLEAHLPVLPTDGRTSCSVELEQASLIEIDDVSVNCNIAVRFKAQTDSGPNPSWICTGAPKTPKSSVVYATNEATGLGSGNGEPM